MELVAAVLAGFVVAPCVPLIRRFGRDRTGWILALVPLAICIYLTTFIGTITDGETHRVSYAWVPSLHVNLSFSLDGLSLVFGLLIAGIGALILIYTGGYMAGDSRLNSFYAYLLMFMGSMLGIVMANNVLTLFVFWELTSITSYLLIGFNHDEEKSRTAALQALIITILGSQAMLGGLLLLGHVAGTYELSEILTRGDAIRDDALYVPILLLILAGAFTKSAQTPFHFWLPNAMEAPTPVSAYLHSATMVKAGIYLLARFSPALGGTDLWTAIVTATGAATMIVGAYLAFPQSDIKRALAYATVSVLGTLMMLIGLGTEAAIEAAVVYLLVHSLYKGALFLVAGIIDHETGTRDLNELGGLRAVMPLTAVVAILAVLSMAGLPPLFGFIGKELVYEAVIQDGDLLVRIVAATAVLANIFMLAVAGFISIGPFFGRRRPTPKAPNAPPLALWIGPALLAGLGLLFGILPSLFDTLTARFVEAIHGNAAEVHLNLWHGFNTALALSAVTVALGAGLYAGRDRLRPLTARLGERTWWGPERWYRAGLKGLYAVADIQTRLLQSGYLRYYLIIIVTVTVMAVGFPLVQSGEAFDPGDWRDVRFYEVGVALMILVAAFQATRLQSRLGAIVTLGVIGYGMALIFILFGAPDLAMTQVLIETLMIVLFVLVLYRLPRYVSRSTRVNRARDVAIALTVGGMMTMLVLAANSVPTDKSVATFYAEESYPQGHGRNVVNVILVDFRALDTLGEITVLATAAIGVYALMKLRMNDDDSEQDAGS